MTQSKEIRKLEEEIRETDEQLRQLKDKSNSEKEPPAGFQLPPGPTLPSIAPWEAMEALIERIDTLISIMQARGLMPTVAPTVEIEQAAAPQPVPVVVTIAESTRVYVEPVVVMNESIRNTNAYHSKVYDWRRGARLLVWVESTLDAAVTIQTKGNIKPVLENAVRIGQGMPCEASSKISIILADREWHPYIGFAVAADSAPTTGTLSIIIVAQE